MCFQWWLETTGGMSDLSIYELVDNVWDEFSASDDHIVPHPAGGYWAKFGVQSDSRKKSRYDIIGAHDASQSSSRRKEENSLHNLTKQDIMLEKGMWSHAPDSGYLGACDIGTVKDITSISSEEGRIPVECLNNENVDTIGSEFCAEDPILGEKCTAASNNEFRCPPTRITQTDNDLSFFNNDEDKESSDLLYYGWPDDIGNFEDVDRMFRSCDSTFGLESLGNEDDLCWFSSPKSIQGSDDALKLDSKFSTSEPCVLNSVSDHHESSGLNCLGPFNDSDKKSSSVGGSTSSRTADAVDQAAVSHITSLNASDAKSVAWDRKQARNQNQSEGKKKDRHVKNGTQRHKQNTGSNSLNHMQEHVPYMYLDFSQPMDQISLCPSQPGSTTLYDPVSAQMQSHQPESETEGHSEIQGASTEVPAELDSSNMQESSCMGSVLDEISFEATSFRQLQQVMEQLDIRTKLCIRDSLYRLARSAEQRHNCGNLKGGERDDRDRSCALMAEETNKSTGFLDMETETNPIDRSIAHLLFHRPSDPSVIPANDALSNQSHPMIHGSSSSPPAMTKEQVLLEDKTAEPDQSVSICDGKQRNISRHTHTPAQPFFNLRHKTHPGRREGQRKRRRVG